ncbi:hypothetical protein AX17_005932 [Amanita inopinata Kibby_2008]|nr:hypothetical protein AX17_005932 [Amanita inopinata Kibby_2008]
MPSSLVKESAVDVLIIGAGPAGLMACNALAKAGVNVRIIDMKPVKVMVGQADGISPRTIEVFQSYGLAERLLKEGNQIHLTAFYNPGPDGAIELTDRVADVTVSDARYPYEVTIHQGVIEDLFLDSMGKMGVEVSRPVIPVSMQLSDDLHTLQDLASYPVRVMLKHLDSLDDQVATEVVHAKFVIGTDGAHSWVRKSLGIAMEGEQTDYVWGVVDVKVDTDFPDVRNKAVTHSNNGSCFVIPREDDKVRLYIQLGQKDAIDDATGRVSKAKISPHYIFEVAKKSLYPYTFETRSDFEWWTLYQVGQRVASQYSVKERIFIAGDACHTHSPKAGQGMNASMSDTHNLAWKLTYVLRGWAHMSLLRTYEDERRQYALDLIAFDRNFAKLFSKKPKTEEYQDGVTHEEFLRAFQVSSRFISGIGVHYADSAIVHSRHQQHARDLIIGERVPPQILLRAADGKPTELQDLLPSDTRFKVLFFVGDTSIPEQLQRVHTVAGELVGSCDTGIDGILPRYVPEGRDLSSAMDVLTISSSTKKTFKSDVLPKVLRTHWSKIFIDDEYIHGIQGGDAYAKLGVNPEGAVVIVRPDGYVGMVAPFDQARDINSYFASFLKARS